MSLVISSYKKKISGYPRSETESDLKILFFGWCRSVYQPLGGSIVKLIRRPAFIFTSILVNILCLFQVFHLIRCDL